MVKAKRKSYEENFYSSLSEKDWQRKVIRIAKQKNKEAEEVYHAKGVDGSGVQILKGEIHIRGR